MAKKNKFAPKKERDSYIAIIIPFKNHYTQLAL